MIGFERFHVAKHSLLAFRSIVDGTVGSTAAAESP
jgi:hypothetical protein